MLAVAGYLNIRSDIFPRIATGFCGGISRTGGMCGAVSGGILSLGLAFGRSSQAEKSDQCYTAVRGFMKTFASQFGSLYCPELTGFHLGTPQGHAAFMASDQMAHCTEYVVEATRLVVDILDQQKS